MSDSKVGINDPFINDQDNRFAELTKDPLFWAAIALSKAKDMLRGTEFDNCLYSFCLRLSVEGWVIFELRHRRNFTIDQIVEYGKSCSSDPGEGWQKYWVELVLLLLEVAREAWDTKDIVGSPETYRDEQRVILRKAFDGEELTRAERMHVFRCAVGRIACHEAAQSHSPQSL